MGNTLPILIKIEGKKVEVWNPEGIHYDANELSPEEWSELMKTFNG